LGISFLVVAVMIFVAIGIAIELVYLPKSSAPTSTTTTSTSTYCSASCPPPSSPLKTAVDAWVQDFNTRNVEGLSGFYATDSTVTWLGGGSAGSGLDGTYSDQANVRILYGSSIGKTLILNASISNYAEKPTNPDNVNVTMIISMNGNSSVVGTMNAVVQASQEWHYTGGEWQIVKENWNYQTFNVEFPQSSTTFPQWGALKTGKNPDLVSEKSFEWHVGPWVAASIYAVLFAVLAIGVIEYRRRSRSA